MLETIIYLFLMLILRFEIFWSPYTSLFVNTHIKIHAMEQKTWLIICFHIKEN